MTSTDCRGARGRAAKRGSSGEMGRGPSFLRGEPFGRSSGGVCLGRPFSRGGLLSSAGGLLSSGEGLSTEASFGAPTSALSSPSLTPPFLTPPSLTPHSLTPPSLTPPSLSDAGDGATATPSRSISSDLAAWVAKRTWIARRPCTKGSCWKYVYDLVLSLYTKQKKTVGHVGEHPRCWGCIYIYIYIYISIKCQAWHVGDTRKGESV